MKTSTAKQLFLEIYIDIIFCLIGLVTLYALYHQIEVLGGEVFSVVPQKPVTYAKTEHNVANLLLFVLISFSSLVYGGVGIFRLVRRLGKSQETSREAGTH